MEIIFVLVQPRLPENIGAAARAIKTMGFHSLRLINPANHLDDRAKWMAFGSNEILEKAEIFSDLPTALGDIDLAIGTTVRKRAIKQNYLPPEKILELVREKEKLISKVGLIFGNEKGGLKTSDLRQCDLVSTIPMSSNYPSLNLAQAVMVYAYVFYGLNFSPESRILPPADSKMVSVLQKMVTEQLSRIGIKTSMTVHSRLMERLATLKEGDVKLLHFILKKLSRFLAGEKSQPDVDDKIL